MGKRSRFILITTILIFTFVTCCPLKKNVVEANAGVGVLTLTGGVGTGLGLTVSAPVVLAVGSILIATGVVYHNRDELKHMIIGAYSVAKDYIKTGADNTVVITSTAKEKILDYVQGLKNKSISNTSSSTTFNNSIPVGEGVYIPCNQEYKEVANFTVNGSFKFRMSLQLKMSNLEKASSTRKVYYRVRIPSLNYVSDASTAFFTGKDSNGIIDFLNFKRVLSGNGKLYISSNVMGWPPDNVAFMPDGTSICIDVKQKVVGEVNPGSICVNPNISNDIFKDNFNNVAEKVGYNNPSIAVDGDIIFYPSRNIPLDNIGDVVGSLDGVKDVDSSRVGDISKDIPKDTSKDTPKDTSKDIPKDVPGIPPLDLSLPQDVSLDFSPLKVNLKDKFPFCIPFDLVNSIKSLRSTPKAPLWKVNIPSRLLTGGCSFSIDFSIFSEWASIVRWGILICFNISLILITRRIIK